MNYKEVYDRIIASAVARKKWHDARGHKIDG